MLMQTSCKSHSKRQVLTTQKTDKNEEIHISRFRWSDQFKKTIPQKMSIINIGFGRILMEINIGIMPLG